MKAYTEMTKEELEKELEYVKEEYERFRREHEQSHAQQHNW